MKVVYTEQAFESLEEIKELLSKNHSPEKIEEIRTKILDKAESLIEFSERGQIEENLISLKKGHRYILEKHTKIIYRIIGKTIYVTDFFDTRQAPSKMKY